MLIKFENHAVTAVSEGIQCRGDYEHPMGRTLFHVAINGPEEINDQGHKALVSHGVSFYVDGAGMQPPLKVGDHVSMKALLEARWDSYSKQMRNDLNVIQCSIL